MPKFFVDKNNIGEKNIEITGDDAKHISTVLRAKVDEEIIICDGYGTDYLCRLIGINKKQVLAEIIEKYENKNEPELKITLYQGLPKGDKMELVIQKCIEIGVDRIIPVITDNTVVKIGDKAEKKNLRWNKIAEAAAKQCGRGKIPHVDKILSFKDAVETSKTLDGVIIPYENERKKNIREFVKSFRGKSIGIFIGPEGGFSENEITLCMENNISSVSLGKRILRTETAGLVTSVILLYELEGLI
ncbi:MAG: 16S rRNA (uracil(1498)-N(3))-methyltransferase [Clostridiales bacterium]|nr:16S rRNA (uracil(1498)-N(3))-methyltransferase [Clostridiales bacterium]